MEYIERLEKTITELENNSGKLADLPELVKGITELISIYRETNNLTLESQKQLDIIEHKLRERLDELQKALQLEQDSKEELLNTIRSVLTANNKEQLDAVNSITTVVNNKIAVSESNIIVKTTEINNDVKQVETKTSKNGDKLNEIIKSISNLDDKICLYGDKTESDLNELKNMIPVIKRLQIITIVTALFVLLGCVLNVVI